MSTLTAGYYQFRPRFGEARVNLKRIIEALAEVRADLVVLPELALTGYYFKDHREAWQLAEDPARSFALDSLIALCKLQRFSLVLGFAERRRDKVFNSSALLTPAGIKHIYRKLHLFNDEKSCFDTGDIPLSVQKVKDAKVGQMICFDWAFPEVARTLVLRGADVLAHPSNLVLTFCQQTMLTRCLENRCFAITANRYGTDDRPHGTLKFTGRSQIVAPSGVRLAKAPAARAQFMLQTLDLQLAIRKMITPRNHLLKDRRPEFYKLLTR